MGMSYCWYCDVCSCEDEVCALNELSLRISKRCVSGMCFDGMLKSVGSVVGGEEVYGACKEYMEIDDGGMEDIVEVFDALNSPLVCVESGSRRVVW